MTREAHEDSKPTVISKEDHDESENMTQIEDKCYEVVAPMSILQLLNSFTIQLLDLTRNPFQEKGNDESMGDIERVIEEIVKLMEQSDYEELGFYEEPVTSKLARNRPERKPI